MPESPQYDVFVSHAAKDKRWAAEFVEALKQEGVRAWFDQLIDPGERWDEKVEEALRESRAVVFLFTPDHLNSSWASFEIGAALADKKKIIPILRENVDRAQLPPVLQRLAWLEEESPRVAGKRVAELVGHKSEV